MTRKSAQIILELEKALASARTKQRDAFAMAALQGMLASEAIVDRTKVNKAVWAAVAYEFADAMLKERASFKVPIRLKPRRTPR